MTDSVTPAKLDPREVLVPSYTEDEVYYRVHRDTLSCDDPGRTFNPEQDSCKHSRLVSAIEGSTLDLKSATRGLLQDGTRVIVLESMDAFYYERTWGFDQGIYSHELCFDGEQLMVISTDLATATEQRRYIHDANAWNRHIPPTQEDRKPKILYRKPNYEWTERPPSQG